MQKIFIIKNTWRCTAEIGWLSLKKYNCELILMDYNTDASQFCFSIDYVLLNLSDLYYYVDYIVIKYILLIVWQFLLRKISNN